MRPLIDGTVGVKRGWRLTSWSWWQSPRLRSTYPSRFVERTIQRHRVDWVVQGSPPEGFLPVERFA